MTQHHEAFEMLKATSRTFYIPITYLSSDLKDAVGSAYLCMRAIDEIEDHEEVDPTLKSELLHSIATCLENSNDTKELNEVLKPHSAILPEVSLKIADWFELCPKDARPKVMEATAEMARGMATWVEKNWQVQTEEELDEYTYYVAGLVGVMLSDLWNWYDGIDTDKDLAIAFGRGLQSVNILRNKDEDRERGVNFFPEGWGSDEMFDYAKRNLALADEYVQSIKNTEVLNFCKIPLALAHSTLETLASGNEKLSRTDVKNIVSQVVSD